MTALAAVSALTPEEESSNALAEKASDVAMSVRMATSMMAGVAEALATTSKDLTGYEADVARLQAVSTGLQQQMQALLALSGKVGGLLEIIEKVAMQTRLLAFNATLEAARAGEQGRGFAVVATSVKDLALQTGGATSEIREALERIADAARHTGSRSTELDAVVGRIRGSTEAFVGTLSEQAEVTTTACKYVDEAASNVDEIASSLTAGAT